MSVELPYDPSAEVMPGAAAKTHITPRYLRACRCDIRVHLQNGKAPGIEATPGHSQNPCHQVPA